MSRPTPRARDTRSGRSGGGRAPARGYRSHVATRWPPRPGSQGPARPTRPKLPRRDGPTPAGALLVVVRGRRAGCRVVPAPGPCRDRRLLRTSPDVPRPGPSPAGGAVPAMPPTLRRALLCLRAPRGGLPAAANDPSQPLAVLPQRRPAFDDPDHPDCACARQYVRGGRSGLTSTGRCVESGRDVAGADGAEWRPRRRGRVAPARGP
jgi:hypothetical protein